MRSHLLLLVKQGRVSVRGDTKTREYQRRTLEPPGHREPGAPRKLVKAG